MNRREYLAYLKSAHWKDLRRRALTQGFTCRNCKDDKKIHVHHIRYRNLVDCRVGDLVVLCEKCHNRIHDIMRDPAYKGMEFDLPAIIALLGLEPLTRGKRKRRNRRKLHPVQCD